MNREARFDVFKTLPGGNSLWITTAQSLTAAEKRMADLASIAPGEYFVYSQGKILAEFVSDMQPYAQVI